MFLVPAFAFVAPERWPLVGRYEQRANAIEAIGCDKAQPDQFDQPLLDLRWKQLSFADQVSEKERATVLEELQNFLRFVTEFR